MLTGRWEPELRALAEGTPSAGGYVIPTPLALQVVDLLRNQAQVHRAGAVSVTMNSATLKMARLASDVTAGWKAENAAMTYSDNSFQQILFTANTLIAGAKISLEMIEDSENIDAVVSNSISKALALALDYAALYGSGAAPVSYTHLDVYKRQRRNRVGLPPVRAPWVCGCAAHRAGAEGRQRMTTTAVSYTHLPPLWFPAVVSAISR